MKRVVVVVTLAALTLTACGGESEPAAEQSQSAAAPSASAATPEATSSASSSGGPEITKTFITPRKLDVSAGSASVEVRVQLADEDGVDPSALITLTPPQSGNVVEAQLELIQGDPGDGAYKADVTIPQGAAAGSWVVAVSGLKDRKGNETTGETLAIDSIEVVSK